jgi:hypothetical protein
MRRGFRAGQPFQLHDCFITLTTLLCFNIENEVEDHTVSHFSFTIASLLSRLCSVSITQNEVEEHKVNNQLSTKEELAVSQGHSHTKLTAAVG